MSEDVDQEALQRITELRVRLLKERLQAEQQEPDEQRWQQHEIEQKRIREHHEHLRLMIESKQQQIRQLNDTTQHMREQLAMRNSETKRESQRNHYRTDEAAGASKLDAILAQTLQMQTMFMAHMAAQGFGGANSGGSVKDATVMPHRALDGQGDDATRTQPSFIRPGGVSQLGHANIQEQEARSMQPADNQSMIKSRAAAAAAAAAAAGAAAATEYAEQDIHLLNQLQDMTDKLSRADAEAHNLAEAALQRARAQDTPRDGGPSPDKKARDGKTLEEDDDETFIEDGDEITHDEMTTFHEIAFSWLKKVVKHVIINVLMEADLNLEICSPFKGSFFRKGVTQQDVDSRVIKLAVRCKSIVKSLVEACTKEDTPEAVISFLQRLVAHRQKYPGPKAGNAGDITARSAAVGADLFYQHDGSYLFPSEREMLKLEEDGDRADEITMTQARFLIAHFLFGRILVKQLLLEPWSHGVGPKGLPNKVTMGSLRVIAFMLYNALSAGFQKNAGPTHEASILGYIGSLPGEEPYLLSVTTDLQSTLKVGISQFLDKLMDLCFPDGKPPFRKAEHARKLSVLDQFGGQSIADAQSRLGTGIQGRAGAQ